MSVPATATPAPGLDPATASQIAQSDPVLGQNQEPGFANTFGRADANIVSNGLLALPALGMGALSLYLLHRKRQQDKEDQLREQGLVVKSANFDVAALKAHLPGFHAPDMLLGGAAGAGAGALYDYFKGAPKGKRFSSALKRILGGAAIGALGTNLIGDRARRYISNSVAGPFSYSAEDALTQLKPRSLAHVRDALVLDKPAYDPAAVEKLKPHFGGQQDVASRAIAARRELNRIAMGVHANKPDTDIWQKNTDKGKTHYSLNERNRDYLSNLAALMLPSSTRPSALRPVPALSYEEMKPHLPPEMTKADYDAIKARSIHGLFVDPAGAISAINTKGDWRNTDLFGSRSLLGSQQLITRPVGKNIDGAVLDRYDVTPEKKDVDGLLSAILSGKIFSSQWRNEKNTDPNSYAHGQTNAQISRGTLGRLIWDKILARESPWVSQKFRFTPGESGEHSLQLLRQDGAPATENLTPEALANYLQALQQQ